MGEHNIHESIRERPALASAAWAATLRVAVAAAGLFYWAPAVGAVDVLSKWTFESSQPATAGPFNAEVGVFTGAASQAIGSHVSGATAYNSPVGNGSSHSFSSNSWTTGDYYQFRSSTTGYSGITLSWDQTRSTTGPADFTLQYSLTGVGAFTNLLDYTVPAITWFSGSPDSGSVFIFDASAISGLGNAPNVYFRLASRQTAGAAGTNRVDNFTINGITLGPIDASWTNPSGGMFSTGSNWSTGTAPRTQDRAIFDLPTTYTVAFAANRSTTGLTVSHGNVTFDLQGHSYEQQGNVAIFNSGTQLHTLGNYQQTAGSFALFDGASVQTDGTFNYSGMQSFHVLNGSTFSVGNAAASSIQVGETHIDGDSDVAIGTFTSNNHVTVNGSGTSLHVLGNYQQTAGSFALFDGASVQTDGTFSYVTVGPADLTVSGGSLLKAGNTLRLSSGNTLHVDATSSVVIGNGTPQLPGKVLVLPGGTLAGRGTIATNVVVDGGRVAPGSSPGILNIDGDYTQTASGVLEIEVGGHTTPGTDYDQVAVTGMATLGGRLDVPIISGFVPAAGNEITILTARPTPPNSVTGSFNSIFSSNLASVSPNLALKVVYNASDVRLQFVTPSTDIQFAAATVAADWTNAATWSTGVQPDTKNIITVQNLAGAVQTVKVSNEDAFVHQLNIVGNANTITVNVQNGNSLSATAGTTIGSQAAIELGTMSQPNDRGNLVSSSVEVMAGGQLSGNGTVVGNLSVGTATGLQTAILSPGFSVGHLDVDGTYQQGSNGTLLVDIENASTFDSIDVTGTAMLGGTLQIDVSNLGSVSAGTLFPIMTAENITGTFDNIESIGNNNVYFITTMAGPGAGSEVASGTSSDGSTLYAQILDRGDMNGDGVIDSADFDLFAFGLMNRSTAKFFAK